MGIEDQLGEQPEFDRIGMLQELFDQATKVQLDAGDLIVRLGARHHDAVVTAAELLEVLEVALAAVQGARQCLIETHFALTGNIPDGA